MKSEDTDIIIHNFIRCLDIAGWNFYIFPLIKSSDTVEKWPPSPHHCLNDY